MFAFVQIDGYLLAGSRKCEPLVRRWSLQNPVIPVRQCVSAPDKRCRPNKIAKRKIPAAFSGCPLSAKADVTADIANRSLVTQKRLFRSIDCQCHRR